ncbi:vWA domain-containing protein [Halorientalis salina]|uniref:vWA domain-containing protein n=1 Tax=Halorientalis salina TaxID=2932266 RepID=UPI0010ABED14|nr:vWA domain-containing protein [Halorientalis salina]
MAVETSLAGVTAGLQRPLVLLAFPVIALLFGVLYRRRREGTTFSRRGRALVFVSRLLVVALLVVGAAGPYTLATAEVSGDPQVRMLVDRSASMAATDAAPGDLASAIESEGVAVRTRSVGSDRGSPVGDAVAGSLSTNGSVLVVSDGRVTDGRSLDAAAGIAQDVNASIHAVNVSTTATERVVTVAGPAKTSTGVENSFRVGVTGVELDDSVDLTVTVDGEEVVSERVEGQGGVEFAYNFSETGSHRVTARIDGADVHDRNDVFRKTVRVVEPPKILYVSRGEYPLAGFLDSVYEVDRTDSIPDDLSEYYAVVVQDMAADDLGNVTALQRAVIDGTGLVTVGGENAFEYGNYRQSLLTEMLPVTIGEGGRTSRVVIAVDISGSTQGTLSVQQALALDVLDQLGDRNQVGVVAFNRNVYRIADVAVLGNSRDSLSRQIRRLESDGGTDVSAGIEGATQMLGGGGGTVILLTDGRAQVGDAPGAAAEASRDGVQVIPVGVGSDVAHDHLERVADAGDGTYLRADETDRLRILFGGETREYRGGGLTVVDGSHFITSGVRFEATPGRTHAVAAADRADFLVAGPSGNPAISAWRYGLGRTVAITAYDQGGTLGDLLSSPDSVGVTKSVNWAIGDPERLETGVTDISDARVGSPVTVTYEGPARPSAGGVRFTQAGEGQYEATVVPEQAGYESVLGATYAVNYPQEYAAYGQSPALGDAVETTGGQFFEPDQAAAIAEQVRRDARTVRTVTREWTWLLVVVALLTYLAEVSARRYYRIKS